MRRDAAAALSGTRTAIRTAFVGFLGAPGVGRLEVSLALLCSAFIAVPTPVVSRLSVGSVLLVIASPWWTRRVWADKRVRAAIILLTAVAVAGLATAAVSLQLNIGRSIVPDNFIHEVLSLVRMGSGLLAAYWLAMLIGVRRVAVLTGLACTIGGFIALTPEQAENPWKYVFAWPVCLLVVALVCESSLWLVLTTFVVLAGVSLFASSRNAAGALVVSALAVAFSRFLRRQQRSRRTITLGIFGLLGASVLAFAGVVGAISSGIFGDALAKRQAYQMSMGLLTGRVEPSATLSYFRSSPLGYGLGVMPSSSERADALRSLIEANGVNNMPYVEERLIGGRIDLHSIAASLWFDAGLVGLAGATVVAYLMVRGLLRHVAAYPVIAFTAVQGLWDLLFSPLDANGRSIGFTVGVILAAWALQEGCLRKLNASPPEGSMS